MQIPRVAWYSKASLSYRDLGGTAVMDSRVPVNAHAPKDTTDTYETGVVFVRAVQVARTL